MSSQLYSEISAHLLATTPTALYLEYVDWADKILQDPLAIEDGHARIPARPGKRHDTGYRISPALTLILQSHNSANSFIASRNACGCSSGGQWPHPGNST